MNNNLVRKAKFAGSWYDGVNDVLDASLTKWIGQTTPTIKDNQLLKAVIVPHAGYDYSGQTAAWCYSQINPDNYDRVILLGPCHQLYLTGCGLSSCTSFATPLGNITIDTEVIEELSKVQNFVKVKKKDEESEHSLELQLPYLRKVFGTKDFKLVPIMVGNLSKSSEASFGKVFKKFLEEERTLFVVSSDFCHWGSSFDYTYYEKNDGPIHKSIEKLDKRGIDLIENLLPEEFQTYLDETENTICGRHPIAVYLFAQKEMANPKFKSKLVCYSQSNQVTKMSETSVSYASIISYLEI